MVGCLTEPSFFLQRRPSFSDSSTTSSCSAPPSSSPPRSSPRWAAAMYVPSRPHRYRRHFGPLYLHLTCFFASLIWLPMDAGGEGVDDTDSDVRCRHQHADPEVPRHAPACRHGGSYTLAVPTISIILTGRYNSIADPHEVALLTPHPRTALFCLTSCCTDTDKCGMLGSAWRCRNSCASCGARRTHSGLHAPNHHGVQWVLADCRQAAEPNVCGTTGRDCCIWALSLDPKCEYFVLQLYKYIMSSVDVAKCVEIGLPQIILMVALSQYIPNLVPLLGTAFERFTIIMSVALVWLYAIFLISVPYPFRWGAPTYDIGEAFVMMSASFVALVESTGAFIAVSRYASTTPCPPSVMSRGIGWQGVGILLGGLFGTAYGSSVSVENAGLLGLTRVGSRRVVQISAGFMIFSLYSW
uniref:Uncharacterized protein n=2 Tax=Oryza meridionalis TaxID=40149 RepID=A0A0E0EBK0_9ORYZ